MKNLFKHLCLVLTFVSCGSQLRANMMEEMVNSARQHPVIASFVGGYAAMVAITAYEDRYMHYMIRRNWKKYLMGGLVGATGAIFRKELVGIVHNVGNAVAHMDHYVPNVPSFNTIGSVVVSASMTGSLLLCGLIKYVSSAFGNDRRYQGNANVDQAQWHNDAEVRKSLEDKIYSLRELLSDSPEEAIENKEDVFNHELIKQYAELKNLFEQLYELIENEPNAETELLITLKCKAIGQFINTLIVHEELMDELQLQQVV